MVNFKQPRIDRTHFFSYFIASSFKIQAWGFWMDKPLVYFGKDALLDMICTAVEVFKRECIGLVRGHKPTRARYYYSIEHIVPISLTSERTNSGVQQSKLSFKNLDMGLINQYPQLFKVIGRFHSHPEWGRHKRHSLPSDADKRDLIESGLPLEIIINISSLNKERVLWESVSGGGIRGSLGKYKFGIKAFELTRNRESGEYDVEMLSIEAQDALRAFNRTLGYQ